jgi:serine/threonine-protein kinase
MPFAVADFAALSRLLDDALALDADAREAWFQVLPEADRPHVPLLRMMLSEFREPDRLATLAPLGPTTHDEFAAAGDRVGPYRLLRQIGHGGMGAVWLAERADGSFERHVALKLPRLAWGAGLAERMARERRIAALLEHPNIARLYDAGVDDRGRPYLALEYIEGRPIDAWCEEKSLPVPARLRLIVQVARAVAYAHGRLVVHRDLKPSNVLVSADGETHLLDFGIAKRLQEDTGDETQLTREQGRVLTPHFASPEQMRGDPVTVQSDVYSLGVLLYRLLTGELPYRPRRSTLAALEEAMLEGEPVLASRRADDRVVARQLRGELDAILAKALRRDPRQRYATADALADDIERHLSGERVLAQTDSAWYRIRKAMQRHRVGFTTGTAVLTALLLGAGAALVQARKASDAAEQARVVKDFVVDVFKVNGRDNAANNELRQLPAEMLLERGARLIDTRFAGRPRLQAELYGVVGGIFADMGSTNLAEQYATRQIASLALFDAEASDQAKALILLARALMQQDKLADAELSARRAIVVTQASPQLEVTARLALIDVLLAQSRIDIAKRELAVIDARLTGGMDQQASESAKAEWVRARLLYRDNRMDLALPVYERAIDAAVRAEGLQSRLAVEIRLDLVTRLLFAGQVDAAKRQLANALATLRALGGADDIGAALAEAGKVVHMFSGHLLSRRMIPFEEASASLDRIKKRFDDPSSRVPDAIRARIEFSLGQMYQDWGDVERGHTHFEASAATLLSHAEAPFTRMIIMIYLGLSAMDRGEHQQADKQLRDALELAKVVVGPRPTIASRYWQVARNLSMQGRFDEAEAVLMSVPNVAPLHGAIVAPMSYADSIPLALALVKLDRKEPAAALALLPPEQGDIDDYVFQDRRLLRGAALCALGRAREGLPLMETHTDAAARESYAYHPHVAYWRATTGLCALDAGDRGRAVELAALAREAFTRQPGVSPYYKAQLAQLNRKLRR